MTLSHDEKELLVKYILPAQGNLKTLELVDSIILKILDITVENIIFSDDEWRLIKIAIDMKDKNGIIPYECLNLVRKLLKGEN